MEINTFAKLIRKRQKTIWSFTTIILVISLIMTFTQPLKYTSKSKLLVAQNTMGADPYAVSRSNEYLGNLFSQVAYSSSFFNLVVNSQFNIDKNYFNGDSSKQMKRWKNTISAKSLGDTGIISISVYHPNPAQARQITLAINDVLINKNFNYQGLGNLVKVNVIDQPIVSNYPNKPNAILNTLLALLGGFIFSALYIYYFPEDRYAFQLIRLKKKVKKHQIKINDLVKEVPRDIPNNLPFEKSAPLRPEHLENINDLITKEPLKENVEEEYRGDMDNIINRY